MKGYWIICVKSYEIDGTKITKGTMKYYTSTRPIINTDWRKATPDEIETMKRYKGNYFNLKNV